MNIRLIKCATLLLFVLIGISIDLKAQEDCTTGHWEWIPPYPPEWCDGVYFAPKVYCETLRFENKRDVSLTEFLDIEQGNKLTGVLYGLDAGYMYKHPCGFYVEIDSTYAGGKLNGSHSKDMFVYYFDIEGYVGCYINCYNFSVIPYIGIGYSFDRQRFNEKNLVDKTFKLRYHIFYVPVGLKLNYAFSPSFEWGLHFKATPQADSTVKLNFITQNRLELTKRTGYLVESPFTWNIYCFNYVWKVIFTPFWERTVFGKSNAFEMDGGILDVVSPEQIINDTGAKIEVGTLF